MGGTIRWMSPELFYPDRSGLKNARPSKQSDCYAFGMVIYEVLSGQAPFTPFHYGAVVLKVVRGERPRRPRGREGARFTDDLWRTLNRCWATRPQSRPSATTVLECLERISGVQEAPSRQAHELTGIGSDQDPDGSRGTFSWLNPRNFVTFLFGIPCLSQLQAKPGRIVPNKRGGTDAGKSSRRATHKQP